MFVLIFSVVFGPKKSSQANYSYLWSNFKISNSRYLELSTDEYYYYTYDDVAGFQFELLDEVFFDPVLNSDNLEYPSM